MTIGKVIRKYRKLANLTQEEMAVRLGVTAPAVNKWENENSCPDITLLAPIARLLNISLDTLMSFQEDLTEQEIIDLVEQAAQIMKEKSYEEVFRWMKQMLEQYPNCEPLSLNFAAILDAQGIFQGVSEQEKYEKFICGWYERALDSKDENIRTKAADALTNFYLRKKQYDRAEKYLEYLSLQNPEKKRKKAQICAETGRLEEAYKVYEELLFSDYMRVSVELQGIYMLALQEMTGKEHIESLKSKKNWRIALKWEHIMRILQVWNWQHWNRMRMQLFLSWRKCFPAWSTLVNSEKHHCTNTWISKKQVMNLRQI